MRIFVTGGTGFIGSHFINKAHAAGHNLVALRRSPNSQPRIPLAAQPHWIEGAMQEVSLEQLATCEVLVHMAATGVSPLHSHWEELFRVNVQESLSLWLRASEAGVRRFIICGSCFEYGRSGEVFDFIPVDAPLMPTGPYHASKAAASMAALAFAVERKVELEILRPFHVFGEGEASGRFWPALRLAALSGMDFPMTFGEQIRDFVPVGMVAERFLESVESAAISSGKPRIRNVGTGRPQTLRQFAERCWLEWGATGRLLFGEIPYRLDEIMRFVPDISTSAVNE